MSTSVCLCVSVSVFNDVVLFKRYKDTVKTNMKRCGLRPKSLSTAPLDRVQWRTTCQSATASFEESRVAELDRKQAARKQQVINTTGSARFGRATDAAGLLITDWAFRPSAYPSLTQCVVFDAALHASVSVHNDPHSPFPMASSSTWSLQTQSPSPRVSSWSEVCYSRHVITSI